MYFGRALKIWEQATHGGGGGGKGGGGSYSPPPAPDPYQTAAAQGQQDRTTAQANALLLNPSVQSPFGSISYNTNSYDPNSGDQTVNRPTQTITLSPQQQQQYDLRTNTLNSLGQTGLNYAQSLSNTQPITYNTSNIPTSIDLSGVSSVPNMSDYQNQANQAASAYYNQAYNLMQPALEQQQRSLQDQLVNSGNPLNSEAYNTQMGNFQRNEDANLASLADQSVTQGYNIQNQLFNNANTTRQNQIQAAYLPYNTASQLAQDQFTRAQAQQNQNLNAISALLNGSQAIQNPTTPSSSGYNQAAMPSVPIGNYINQGYQNQLQAYNTGYGYNMAQNNAMTSGLFSLGSAFAPEIGGLFG